VSKKEEGKLVFDELGLRILESNSRGVRLERKKKLDFTPPQSSKGPTCSDIMVWEMIETEWQTV
jgi:hypothetical protein